VSWLRLNANRDQSFVRAGRHARKRAARKPFIGTVNQVGTLLKPSIQAEDQALEILLGVEI